MNIEKAFAKINEAEIISLPIGAPEADADTIVSPIPASMMPIEQAAASLGRSLPDNLWKYHDGDGSLLFAVARWNDANGNKASFLPISCVRGADGTERFAFKHLPAPRPLYGLPDLRKRPNAPVVIVEGEKCADAAKAVFPSSVVVTSPGGSNGAAQVDWAPLAGRSRVLIWPDLDAAGTKFATAVASILSGLGIPEILIVDAQRIAHGTAQNKRETVAGWDIADAVAEGSEGSALRVAAIAAAQSYRPGPRFLSFGNFTMFVN